MGAGICDRVNLTLNGIKCGLLVLWVQIANGLAHHETQFNLIVQRDTLGAEDRASAGGKDGGGRLEEEEWLLGSRGVQLGNVIATELGLARSVTQCCPGEELG